MFLCQVVRFSSFEYALIVLKSSVQRFLFGLFLASSFSCVKELASRQTPNLEDQDLSRVISPRWIAFTTAEDSRLVPNNYRLPSRNHACATDIKA